MSINFLTQSQQMIFVDAMGNLANAEALLPATAYDVFISIENNAVTEATNVEIQLDTTPFGIGLPGGTLLITPPDPIVGLVVPPMAFGINGQLTVRFQYNTPAGGHGCIIATIISENPAPSISQNTTIMGVPVGAPAKVSFFVYGKEGPNVLLTLTEYVVIGGVTVPVPAGQSWNPLFIAPDALIGPLAPTPSPVQLSNLAQNNYYSMTLQVNPPAAANAAHIFHIVGTDPANQNVGEVDIRLEPGKAVALPHPYVVGGYESPDIILTDLATNLPVPIGALPTGGLDTLLRPNTDYGFSVIVHNTSSSPAVNTVVRFWHYEQGLSPVGQLLDVQTVTVPAYGAVEVRSAKNFKSAPYTLCYHHACAVVSIYNALSGTCTTDATTWAQVPATISTAESCSAWRNTDSMLVFIGQPWRFTIGLGEYHPVIGPGPVEIEFQTQYVPLGWDKQEQVTAVNNILLAAGAKKPVALYLQPTLASRLEPIDLGIKVLDTQGNEIKLAAKNKIQIDYRPEFFPCFSLAGVLPKHVQIGDIILVRTAANFKATQAVANKTIEFLQVLHVAGKK